jgi:hypothetical protein
MSNDALRLARDLGNLTSNDYSASGKEAARELVIRERLMFPALPADGAANTTVAANVAYGRVMRKAGRVLNGGIIVGTNVTANVTNYKTIAIKDQAGAALASINTVPTVNSGTGDLVALVPTTFAANTTDANSARFAENDVLVPVIGVGGTGVQMPITAYFVDVEWEGI